MALQRSRGDFSMEAVSASLLEDGEEGSEEPECLVAWEEEEQKSGWILRRCLHLSSSRSMDPRVLSDGGGMGWPGPLRGMRDSSRDEGVL